MARMLRVAAVQYAVGEDVAENLATALRMIDAAASEGAQVVVLPEFANHVSWYSGREHARTQAQHLDGEFVTALGRRAAEHGIHVMANCTLHRPDGRVAGSNILFGPDGAVLAVSDKQVLMGSERDHVDPAVERTGVVETAIGRVGLYSCMDGVIYETPRMHAVEGAELLLNSLNSFALDEASLHVPVRAVENKVWVVAANKVGPLVPEHSIAAVAEKVGVPVDRLHGAGESQVVAPDGTVVAVGPRSGEAVVVADIDLDLAGDKTRPDGTDIIAARRPELYGPIAEEPRGRTAPAGAEKVAAVVLTPGPGDDLGALLDEAVARGVDLVVLPELAAHPDADPQRDPDPALAPEAIAARLVGTSVRVVTSVVDAAGAHVGLVLGAGGVELVQPQLHASARHAGLAEPDGDGIEVLEVPWGRLAVVVGDDALYPETFRLAALGDADVVAVPFTVAEKHDVDLLLLERAAENRLNLAVASRPHPEHGGGALIPLSGDFTLWGDWEGEFAGVISCPEPVLADGAITEATLRPACATNRFVSRGTDVVDGRPWQLAAVLTA
ncbi:carbon-nitrogen hydrolase family protein [Nocardioides sp. zg-ZUI104]|uniref:carbon-nitrogen hydrolase family protein n=1 Tax=Nocardioides faecalis TaxID=2803858 RepID=UPI001BCF0B4B|nr:carbon-nitrogen hydrolase family protein [Nocardioides faecalis]MBS4751443.1 carbon-nitrogen hydrolase family protein [Nocardioides faecalis]